MGGSYMMFLSIMYNRYGPSVRFLIDFYHVIKSIFFCWNRMFLCFYHIYKENNNVVSNYLEKIDKKIKKYSKIIILFLIIIVYSFLSINKKVWNFIQIISVNSIIKKYSIYLVISSVFFLRTSALS